MKRRLIILVVIFTLLLISVVFANSYVQALSKEEKLQVKKEILEQKVKDNKITEEQASQTYKDMEERITNCDNICEQNEDCSLYNQNRNCVRQNNQDLQKNCNNVRNCNRQRDCHNRMCNR